MRGYVVLVFVIFFILSLLAYLGGLQIPYYGDDFQHVFAEPSQAFFHDFTNPSLVNPFYRPLQTLFLSAVQSLWGWDTLPVRLIHLVLHAALAYLIFHILRKWKLDVWLALAGAFYFITAQMNAAAILGNDTICQILSSLLSILTLWLFYSYKSRASKLLYVLSVLTFFLALLAKETGAGLIVAVGLLSFVVADQRRRRIPYDLIPFIACGFIYYLLRMNSGVEAPALGGGQYSFNLGANIFINIGLLALQSASPVSSLQIAQFVNEGNYPALAVIALVIITLLSLTVYGIWRSQHRRLCFALCVLLFLSWFPMIFLNHISEQYVYNSAPFAAGLFAIALHYYLKERTSALKFVIPALILAFTLNIFGIFDKASAMKQQGDRAAVLFPQVVEVARTEPDSTRIYLVQPTDREFYYSVYLVRGFTVISWSSHLLQHFTEKPGQHIYIVDSADYNRLVSLHYGPAYTYSSATYRLEPYGRE